jgi:hypothetical protein
VTIISLPPNRWEEYKSIRLESLREEPQAFGMSYERAITEPDERWQKNLVGAQEGKTDLLYFAEDNGKIFGIMGAFFLKTPETQDSAMILKTMERLLVLWGHFFLKLQKHKTVP